MLSHGGIVILKPMIGHIIKIENLIYELGKTYIFVMLPINWWKFGKTSQVWIAFQKYCKDPSFIMFYAITQQF